MSPGWVRRWLKFNAVGAIGIGVQLAALAFFKGLLRMDILPATALAVECAVLHNFVWHEQWTWRDRTGSRALPALAGRLFRFNVSTGLLSIFSNLVLMSLLVGRLHLHYLIANLLSIAVTTLANFLVSDRLVFREKW